MVAAGGGRGLKPPWKEPKVLRAWASVEVSIACLLLESIGSQKGPTGGTGLSKTTFIQRLNTKGGLAPNDGCATAADVGNQALVPYTADYYFFRKDK